MTQETASKRNFPSPDSGVSRSILVVDDNPSLLRLWKRHLEREHYLVEAVENGDQALAVLENRSFFVIFTDLDLPGMNGIELVREIHKREIKCCVNVITGKGSIESAVECMRLGACDFVSKPFELAEMSALVTRCHRHYRQREENRELLNAVKKLEELDRLKSEFVSNVSHELRTPLFSMGTAVDLLLSEIRPTLGQAQAKLADVIENNYERLHEIVRRVLDFSRIEQGRLKPSFQMIDVVEEANKTAEDIKPLIASRGLVMELKIPAGPLTVEADPGMVQQTLVNLVGNAIKFTQKGGTVGIGVEKSAEGAELVVWDTGAGIPSEQQKLIFERFYQVDGSMTRPAGGSGIGLSLVKAYVEMHGGRVWVDSQPDKGSAFHVVFPEKAVAEKAEKGGDI